MSRVSPVIIIGAGGHAKVLAGLLNAVNAVVIGFTDADTARHGETILGHRVLGGDDVIGTYGPDKVELVLGIGSVRPGPVRHDVWQAYKRDGYRFQSCIHPHAWISPDTEIGAGAQIMAGAVIQPGCRISENSIINTRASVDHDCSIGAHVHIAPGAVLGGTVQVGDGAHVGTGATVIENIRIGDGAMVAAGACVTQDVAANTRVAGVPAKPIGSDKSS
ncbi:MAG: acetyltransferase [Rhodospirillales bacterium]|nr:acetyltransferase [Rhodospirillales bacterium]MBO6787742.1 acetyltransferase [Rhodospirillales bacterium]